MRHILACGALVSLLLLTWNAQSATSPAKKKSAAKKTGTAATARKPASATARNSATARKGNKKPAAKPATWRTRQAAPTPDRYREIQQALVARGYLQPADATGQWNQNSVDALRRFQAEQKIDSSGKINSLSLIALGLGPKHDTAVVKPPAAAQPPVPEAAGPGR